MKCRLFLVLALIGFLPLAYAGDVQPGLAGKFIVGYQGWFGCPGDFEGNTDWQHWFLEKVDAEHLTVELLPSVRGFDPKDLCDSTLKRPDGSEIYLFSSQNPHIVATHFAWMRDHGIDGGAIQRFAAGLSRPKVKSRYDHMLGNVRAAAEASGRVFYVTYDISGADPKTVVDDVRKDWQYLNNDLKITASPNYLLDHGKPVVELWGFGVGDRPGEAGEVGALIADLKAGKNGLQAATVIGGVPTSWRTLNGDSKSGPAWAATYRSYDVISPWFVGRFDDNKSVDAFFHDHVVGDLIETRKLGIGYMPVVFPGFSWSNLMRVRGNKADPFNRIPRHCGDFFWHQVAILLGARVNMLYGAMFDEADEGTAMFPVETRDDKLPVGTKMVSLNLDGCAVPDDWYLTLSGKAAGFLKSQKVPPKNYEAVVTP